MINFSEVYMFTLIVAIQLEWVSEVARLAYWCSLIFGIKMQEFVGTSTRLNTNLADINNYENLG